MYQTIYSPFSRFNGLHKLSRMLDENLPNQEQLSKESTWSPEVDIYETETAFMLSVDIPGVDPKSVDITLDKNVMSISGKRINVTETNESTYKRCERTTGSFNRRFTLPETVDGTQISAKTDLGVLTITIPKLAEKTPINISIDT